jgi:diguanylate cyclase (GGDEF)-like protein
MAGAAVAGSGLLLAAFFVFYLGGWGSETLRTAVTDGVYVPILVVAATLGVRVVRRRELDPKVRRAWRFIAIAYVCQLVAQTSWFIEDVVLHSTRYPAVADYCFLTVIPFMFTGLLLMPGPPRSRTDRIKLALDSLIVGASAFMVLWYLVLGPIFAHPGATVAGLAYAAAMPVGDLLLVLALASLLLRTSTASSSTVRLLAGAVATFVVADVSYGYIQLNSSFAGGTWLDLFWLSGNYLLVLAAYHGCRETGATVRPRRSWLDWLPYVAIGLAYALLLVIARGYGIYPLGGMVFGAVMLTSVVVARQMFALRENRRLACTDALTGLANRILVTERLAQLTARPVREGRHSAVLLIDLDRFKPINDAYGHDAGDAVLTAVAQAMRSVIRPGDTAGRTGGDEFVVLLPDLPDRAAALSVAERLIEALRAPVIFGEHLLVAQASIGVAIRDHETTDGDLLMQRADVAMYAAKRAGRSQCRLYAPELDTRVHDAEPRRAVDIGELAVPASRPSIW